MIARCKYCGFQADINNVKTGVYFEHYLQKHSDIKEVRDGLLKITGIMGEWFE